jgi:3-hydroxyisobutyrate dehydrogenase-like beta-hydroxyacid dehydrogenase
MTETKVGFCGLGTMGAAMATNVARGGFPLTVWNRTPGRSAAPVAAGAVEALSPAAVASASEIVIICVSDTPDVEAVLFGQQGLADGLAEGMVLAMKSGLDARQVVEALSGGAAGSWVLQNRAERMIDDDYPPGFRIALHLKDLTIALDQAREVGAALPVSAMAAQIEAGLVARGHGDDDNSALARAIREWSGM